jgi:hypothetical protein
MDDDLWSLVADWCDHPSDVFTVASLCVGAREATQQHRKELLQSLLPFSNLLSCIKWLPHSSPPTGAFSRMLQVFTTEGLTVHDVMLVQFVVRRRGRSHPVLFLPIGDGMTLSDILEPFVHACPIKTYCKGCGFLLHVYCRSHAGCTMPKCYDGHFYAWGFAMRLGDAGAFEGARSLPQEAEAKRVLEESFPFCGRVGEEGKIWERPR